MPFNKLASFRKVNSLDAEIRGAALCGAEGLVAMVSTDPVRLATNATTGANAKVTNCSLSGADDVVLLNRHAALVRSSDHAVWALLDLTNKAKIDEVSRDVRLLRACPAGNAALGIAWDGSGVHYSAAKTDVEARPFQLRGEVRAADLTDTECWVVAEGEAGGQLRVHQGVTPEPGAVLRANLPAEAKALDRLRVSPRLAVLYKPGGMSCCIATGAPNVLRARMVRLEGKPVDLAVMETSLFALYEDGRVALYDSDAINASAEGGALVAKHTMPTGGGLPRVLLTVVRGPAMLWVGTARGEVMMANVGRKTS
ncbi:MAG TPA: hypothetical protein VHB21_21165 [Minicystis sp.]|nr:hypothetical protein [Minicystis sp.]